MEDLTKLKWYKKANSVIILFIILFYSILDAQSQNLEIKRSMNNYYEKGDYINASFKSIEYLRTNERNKDAQVILSISFNLAVEDIKIGIQDLYEKSKTFIGDQTVNDRKEIISKYELLIKLGRQGREILQIVKEKVPLDFIEIDVKNELELAKKSYEESHLLAAEMHYNKGLELIKNNSRESQKAGAKEFKRAEEFITPYKDCKIRYSEAKKLATTRVAIIPFENKSDQYHLGSIGEMISDRLRASILNNSGASEFVEIYTAENLYIILKEQKYEIDEFNKQESIVKYADLLGIHLIVSGKVMQISVDAQTITDDGVKTTSRQVMGSETYTTKEGKQAKRNVYGDVYAFNFYNHMYSNSSILGSFELMDSKTSQILSTSQFREEYKWEYHYATFDGDERAARVPLGYGRNYKDAPSEVELANQVIDKLGNKIAQNVISLIK